MAAGGATTGTLDDAIDRLQKLVELSELSNDLQRATHSILMAHGQASGTGSAQRLPPGMTPALQANPPAGRGGFVGRNWARVKRWGAGGKARGKGLGKAMGLGSKGIGRMGAAGGTVGVALAAITTVVTGFIAARAAVATWTEAAMASARRLSEISGSMAAVMAERDIGQMRRDLQRGEATAGSARGLMQAESARKDQENRMEIVFDNAKNNVLELLNDIFASALKPIADAMEAVDTAARKWLRIPLREVPPGGLAKTMPDIMDAAHAMDIAGRNLMGIARAAAARDRGAVGPFGAGGVGDVPMGGR